MDANQFIGQLDELLAEFEALKARSRYDDLSDLPEGSARLSTRLQAAFDRMTTQGDTYQKAAEALRKRGAHIKVVELSYLAYAFRDELQQGWFQRAAELVRAASSADMIEMATDLVVAGYKDAAAVITGTALELHLRALATKHSVGTHDAKGKPKKADLLRAELRQAQVTSALQDKRVLYWLGVRNEAAHGNYGSYSSDDVKLFLSEVAEFIDKLPA